MYQEWWEFWGKGRDFWFQEVVGSQIHGESDIWIGNGKIYIMRFDGGKDIPGIAKTYRQFWRTSKNQFSKVSNVLNGVIIIVLHMVTAHIKWNNALNCLEKNLACGNY